MKYLHLNTLLLLSFLFSSCGHSQTNPPRPADPGIFTKYEYTDAAGKRLIIQNGYPRGGSRYTDPNGKVYGYAVFWTRIINETDKPLELKINIPADHEVPSLPGKYFKIVIPQDTMTRDKETLFSYGLTNVASFLDSGIDQPSSLKRTIKPKDSSAFYVLKLSLVSEGQPGGGDVLRTGLILKGQDLFYRVSTYSSSPERKPTYIIGERDIPCGRINMKHLKLLE